LAHLVFHFIQICRRLGHVQIGHLTCRLLYLRQPEELRIGLSRFLPNR